VLKPQLLYANWVVATAHLCAQCIVLQSARSTVINCRCFSGYCAIQVCCNMWFRASAKYMRQLQTHYHARFKLMCKESTFWHYCGAWGQRILSCNFNLVSNVSQKAGRTCVHPSFQFCIPDGVEADSGHIACNTDPPVPHPNTLHRKLCQWRQAV
jgi:hypothetical protein